MAFCESLGCYHRVVTYDALDTLDGAPPSVYIDFAGSVGLRQRIHAHFTGLTYSCSVGASHVGDLGGAGQLPGPRPVMFFAPAQVKKRHTDWGAQGLNDASTAHAFVTAFGKGFQRPLVLLRTLMAEMSEIASGPIQIAPWCCPRMTRPEATLLEAIARVRSNPPAARMLLADLLGVRDASGTAAIAHALADAFADLALPLDF